MISKSLMQGVAMRWLWVVGVLVLGLPAFAQAAMIELNGGTATPYITPQGGDTYQFQYQIATTGDGNGAILVDTSSSGLAYNVLNVASFDLGNYGYLAVSPTFSGSVVYHFQAQPGYVLSNVKVASNMLTNAVGASVAASWSVDDSSYTPLESVSGVGAFIVNNLTDVSGFTGTDLYLQYEVSSVVYMDMAFFGYSLGGGTGFIVQYDLTPPVPEPSTLLLFATGGVMLAGYLGLRWHRDRKIA